MKKIISLVLVLTFLVCSFSFAAYAETTPYFELAGVDGKIGETVEMPLYISNNPGITSLSVKISYSMMNLELVEVEDEGLFESRISTGGMLDNPISISWFDSNSEDKLESGILAVLKFKILEGAEISAVTITYDEDNVFNSKFENIKFDTYDGFVGINDDEPDISIPTEVTIEQTTEELSESEPTTSESVTQTTAFVTDEPTESTTEQPTEKATDKPTESTETQTITYKSTENVTSEPTEPTTEQQTETAPVTDVTEPTARVTETTAPVTEVTEPITDKPTEAPTESTTNATDAPETDPTEIATDKPTELVTKEPTEPIAEKPTETQPVTEKPTEYDVTQPITDKPTEQAKTQPVTDKPTESKTDKPTESVVTQPATEVATQSATEIPKVTSKKKPNPVKVSVKKKTVKAKKLKKKAQKVKAITVKNAQGKVTYKLVKSGITKKIRKHVKINSKGVITIKRWKKAKKGTYIIKVKITAKGNTNYNLKTITKTVKIKII